MDLHKVHKGRRVSVPLNRVVQGRPWEEPYGTVVGSFDRNGVSVRLDGECATIIRIRPEELDEE